MKRLSFPSPLGMLCATEDEGCVVALDFGGEGQDETPLLRKVRRQLEEYFAGARRTFDLPLRPGGTAFQQSVWREMAAIGYGETRTYGQLAAAIGAPKAARAVGMACHRNPLPILLPCHRVLGAGGALTGYAYGLERKRFLLALEQGYTGMIHLPFGILSERKVFFYEDDQQGIQ